MVNVILTGVWVRNMKVLNLYNLVEEVTPIVASKSKTRLLTTGESSQK